MKEEVYRRIMRLVSVVVVLNLAFGGFLGLMLVEEEGVEAVEIPYIDPGNIRVNSDLTIDGATFPNGTWGVDANLTVTGANVNLTIRDTNVVFQYDTDHRFWCKVEDGAILELINSTITVETSDDPGALFDNYEEVKWFNSTSHLAKFKRMIPFTIDILTNGYLHMEQGSSLKYEGKLNIIGANATIRDSVITSPSAPESDYDWGVVVNIQNTPLNRPVIFEDSRIEKSPWFQGVSHCDTDQWHGDWDNITMYENHRIINSEAYFINTYIDLDYQNKTIPALYTEWNNDNQDHYPWWVNPNHNSLVIDQTSTVKFYGLTIDMSETNNKIPTNGRTSIEILDTSSSVTLYRWLAVYPLDNLSVPVEDAVVDITTTKSPGPMATIVNDLNKESTNEYAWAYIRSLIDGTIQQVGTTIQGTTGKSGKVIFALASDMLTETGWPNSVQLPDGYNVVASYINPPGPGTITGLVDFENFPRVFPGDNFVNYDFDPYTFNFQLPHPDLKLGWVLTPPTSTPEGVYINLDVRVFNSIITAPGVTVDDVYVQFWDGDPTNPGSSMIGEDTITQIIAGQNTTTSIQWFAAPPGFHMIYVFVDRDFIDPFKNNLIPEENENNNMEFASITVLERADLAINETDISFDPSEVVDGTAVTIKVNVHNLGGSPATVNVTFYDGTETGKGDFIGFRKIPVSANGEALATNVYTFTSGTHVVWVFVDEDLKILEKNETNNNATKTLVVKPKPDLIPSIDFDPKSPRYQSTVITITATITNQGGWNVTEDVQVRIYKGDPDNEANLIGFFTLTKVPALRVTILAGGSRVVSIQWIANPPGSHTFWVRVDYDPQRGGFPQIGDVVESNETNNQVSDVFVVNPRPNLVILPQDIVFSDPYPMNNTAVDIDFTVRNMGLSPVTAPFYVQIWLDEIGGSGTLLTTIEITGGILVGGSVFQSYNWPSAQPPGKHKVWVWVDIANTIAETNETDNKNWATLIILEVPPDLIVDNAANYPAFSPSDGIVIIDGWTPLAIKGFTLVEESGILIINNSEYTVIGQNYDDEFTIVVKDTGNLTIENSILNTQEFHLTIYLFDGATLNIIGSTIDSNIDIIAVDISNINIDDQSWIKGNLYANDINSHVTINAVNSTFSKNLQYIGGNTVMELWGVYISGNPASNNFITVTENATVYINWYLTINVWDANNVAIENAVVTWYRSPPFRDQAVGNSNFEGKVYFWLRGMNITTIAVVESIGNYLVQAEFTSPVTTLTYYPNANPTVWMTDNIVKTIKFSSVKPELDPPLYVVPDDTIIAVDSPTKVITWINNSGPGNATKVKVKFDDDTTDPGVPHGWPYEIEIGYIKPGGSHYIEFQWIPKLIGWHNISVKVDPLRLIIEENEGNNNNSIPVWVTPRKADLVITDIWYMLDIHNQYGPTENDTIEVHATIRNLGETNAFPSTGRIQVAYRLDDPITGTLLGYGNISGGIPAGQTRESVFTWTKDGQPPTSPPGSYTIYIFADSDYQVEEGNETNNDASIAITLKKYADVRPVSLEFTVAGSPVTSVTDTTIVTITATVENIGETNATEVDVIFYEREGGSQIGRQTISLIFSGGDTGTASVVWEATVVGKSQIHSIYVEAIIVNENILDNNNYSRNLTVTLRPDLSVVDIDFSDNSPEEGQPFTIYASVLNSGGTNTAQFRVGFYDGDPDVDGDEIGVAFINLNIDEIGNVNVNWVSPTKGSHDIYVAADTQKVINEVNEDNNKAYEVIVVYNTTRDIIVNNANTPFIVDYDGDVFNHRGYTLVEENGVLRITDTIFKVLLSADYSFNIIVRNSGTLIIEDGSVMLTNSPLLRIYLYDNSTLYINDSIMDSTVVEIQAFGNAKIFISESTINSNIVADQPTANVQLHSENSSLTQPFIYFGGTSKAVFINVSTPEVKISDNAELRVFRWLKAYVKDGAGTGIEGSTVTVQYDPSGIQIPGSPKLTDFSGLALFDIMTDIVTSVDWGGPLSYRALAEFVFGTPPKTYIGGPLKTSFTSYEFDKVNNVKEITLELSELLPDLKVDENSVVFKDKDGNIRTIVGVGEEITIEATVTNEGNASTTSLTSVLVNFYHRKGVVDVLIGQDVIDTNMAANDGTGVASITWVPESWEEGPGEEIHIHVNPDQAVRETTWSEDNKAYAVVSIVVPPDLDVTKISFNIGSRQNVRNATESETVTILVTIKNLGKQDASDINVLVYDGFPDYDGDMRPDDPLPGGVELIGDSPKNIVSISPNTETTVSITWDTSGMQRGHYIYVYALDRLPNGYIPDQTLSNNNESITFNVHPKPDLRFIKIQDVFVKAFYKDGTELPGNPELYRILKLQARVFNDGQVYIQDVIVNFYDGDPVTGTLIGNDTVPIHPTSPKNASVEWTVTGASGLRTITVVVNANQAVLESNYYNNENSTTLTIDYADISVIFQDIKSKYDLGDTIQIIGEAKFTDPEEAMANVPYTITIYKGTSIHGTPIQGFTDPSGRIIRDIEAPDEPGDYRVEVAVDYGVPVADSKEFKAEGEVPNWFLENLLLILIIIGIAILVVVLVGVLLGRMGLGRLVECGECGAFIPEGEKKCPKCGAVFEADTAKCSECGAWIPVTSKSCPECGAIFAGIEKEKKDYIERMKAQYQEYVDQYRPEAQKDLGTDMTDEEFMEWWKATPKYVGFEEWLAREEEIRKGKTKTCPQCNTVNPESAAICFKCGSVFKKEEEEEVEMPGPPPRVPPKKVVPKRVEKPPEAPPAVVPKKVVRPPEVVPKKVVRGPPTVVPKKVIRPPEGGPPTVVPKKVVKKPPEEEEEE
jgi:subtilase family serine protease